MQQNLHLYVNDETQRNGKSQYSPALRILQVCRKLFGSARLPREVQPVLWLIAQVLPLYCVFKPARLSATFCVNIKYCYFVRQCHVHILLTLLVLACSTSNIVTFLYKH